MKTVLMCIWKEECNWLKQAELSSCTLQSHSITARSEKKINKQSAIFFLALAVRSPFQCSKSERETKEEGTLYKVTCELADGPAAGSMLD